MAAKRSRALMEKMRRLQQKQKGKGKISVHCKKEVPHKEIEPFVTFVEEFEEFVNDKDEEDGMSTTIAQPTLNLERVQFHLDDGRVDVAEVFDHMNTLGLQYESKPGIWCDLKRMKSGKSTKKFKNMQEVHIRRTSLSDWVCSKSKGPWMDEWLVDGDTRKIYCARVSRLSCENGEKVVGTTIRFENPYGLLLTTHHCCTFTNKESGELLTRNDLVAYNTPVEVVHLSKIYDLAFLLLKSGPYVGGFQLATKAEEKRGRELRLLSFPWHVDRAFGFDQVNVGPTEVHGHIANLGPKERNLPIFVDALATYMGGFAASPGGAVTINSKVLVGMHLRAIWHKRGETILPFKEHGKKSPRRGRQECSIGEDFGETSKQRELLTRKKRKRVAQNGYYYKEDSQRSHSNVETTEKSEKVVQKQNSTKCKIYHGYMSTYLSACRIQEEYDDFVKFWRIGSFTKKVTSREVNLSHHAEEENHPTIIRRL